MAKEIGGDGADRNAMAGGDHEKQKLSKRSRTEIPSSSLDVCSFSLVEEVLCRLPTLKSAFRCKCVCKNWYSLISAPYFVRRFISHHFNHQYNQNPSALILNYSSKDNVCRLLPISDEPMFKSSGFELSYLQGCVEVVAICKDLILCKYVWRGKGFLGCVCNPFTKQYVDLPLLKHDKALYNTDTGFVCEPYYFEDSQGECTLNSNYRFRVVRIYEPLRDAIKDANEDNRFILWTYCSETQEWGKSILQGLEYGSDTDVDAYNGKLLWYNGSSIFSYDPFNPELSTFIDCSFIESTEFLGHTGDSCLGVCQGLLRMMKLTGWGTRKSLVVWELKDYVTMEWSLVDKFHLDTITGSLIIDASRQTSLAQEIEGGSDSLNLLGIHPSDKDIVYFDSKAFVISCNMPMRELKMVVEIPCRDAFYQPGNVFHIELPLWPTPIPH